MNVNSINSNNQSNTNSLLAFKSIRIRSSLHSNSSNQRALCIVVRNDIMPDYVFDFKHKLIMLGRSDLAQKMSNAAKRPILTEKNIQRIRDLLTKLRNDKQVNWDFLNKERQEEVDSLINDGKFYSLRDEFIIAKS